METSDRCEIIDAFCTPGPTSVREPGSPYNMEDLAAEHAKFGIRRRLCLHTESRDGVPEEGNDEMDRLADANPGTGVVWAVLPPKRFNAEPVSKLMTRAETRGVAAFTMYPKKQAHDLSFRANRDLFEAMAEARLPLFLEASQASFDELHLIASAFKKLPVVVWGASYRNDRYLVPVMDECPNVYVGLATIFIQTDGIEDFTKRYGPGRLIYGSSWPAQSPGPLISYVTYSTVKDDVKAAVLSGNIRSILSGVKWPVKGFSGKS